MLLLLEKFSKSFSIFSPERMLLNFFRKRMLQLEFFSKKVCHYKKSSDFPPAEVGPTKN